MGQISPMMTHYLETKKQYPDCILFYRLGDFYEMFFEDAKTVSRELELTLTGKDCGLEERAPMCGVQFPNILHSNITAIEQIDDNHFFIATETGVRYAKDVYKRQISYSFLFNSSS